MVHIIFFASSHKIGLTGQLTEQAVIFSKLYPGQFSFVSGEKQQYPNLAEKLYNNKAKHLIINGLDDHSNLWRLVKEFSRIVNSLSPQYVTVQTNWQLMITILAKFFTPANFSIIYIVRGYRHNSPYKSIVARLLIGYLLKIFASKIITPSSFVRNRFSFLGKKNEIIFLGEDEFFFEDHPLPDFSHKKIFVFGGEFRSGKNQEMLIRALKQYILKSQNHDVALYLPGKGERLEACKILCKNLELDKNVIFPGFLTREDMHRLYLKCQFAFVPSNVETFGHCIVEPLLLGRVLFTRHVGVADDIIIDGYNGFFFENEKDLISVMFNVVENNELCLKVSENAVKDKWRFDWEHVCREQYNRIYV